MFKPSENQQAIFDFIKNGEGNGIINAVAGSGKTTTIVKAIELIDESKSVLFLAFNKSIADELSNRIKRKNVDIKTLHSLGMTKVAKAFGGPKINQKKLQGIAYSMTKEFKVKESDKGLFAEKIEVIVNMLRLNFLNPTPENVEKTALRYGFLLEETDVEAIIEAFSRSNRMIREQIDYTDMLYLPVVKGLEMDKYDFVFVDEAQDLSILSQELFKKTLKRSGRFVIVGDPNQSIYAFAGADDYSFQRFFEMPNVIELPLSVCYRCGSRIVENAQKIVPRIQAHHSTGEGIVRNGLSKEIRGGDMVLCRNNKPLVKMFFEIHKRGKKVAINGDEIANDLIKTISQAKAANIVTCQDKMKYNLDKYSDKLRKFGVANPENTNTYRAMAEKVEMVEELIFPFVNSPTEAIALIKNKLKTSKVGDVILLSSIHKAKGLEADRVFILNPELMPSKYSTQPWELQQEQNLKYVAFTRPKKELIFLIQEEKKKKAQIIEED